MSSSSTNQLPQPTVRAEDAPKEVGSACAPTLLNALLSNVRLPICILMSVLAINSCCESANAQNRFGIFQRNDQPEILVAPLERYRVRIVWGGGESVAWRGKLVLSDGQFEDIANLGGQADSGASIHLNRNEIQVNQLLPSEFSGVDVDVIGSKSNRLTITLDSGDTRTGVRQQVIDLTSLLIPAVDGHGQQLVLDQTGNRIDVNRAPGDRLPVKIDRSHLVFEPGEEFRFQIQPFHGLPNVGEHARLKMHVEHEGEQALPETAIPLEWDGQLYSCPDPVSFTLPAEEGVYDIGLELTNTNLVGRLGINRKTIRRSIQVVVVGRKKQERKTGLGQVVLWSQVFDSAEPRNQWIDRLPGVPQFRMASSSSQKGDEDRGVTIEEIDEEQWRVFAPGGWQAVPIQLTALNQPHIIEIDYLDEGPMAMGISVLQPNGFGQVESIGVDSGISIPREVGTKVSDESTTRRHRIFFWPNSETTYLLFANRHKSRMAKIGGIRVLAGPDQLAAVSRVTASNKTNQKTERRQYMAFYEKPFFVENFTGPRKVDPATGQAWHDWQSFLTGANRWVQYLKANGYTSAMLMVNADGSALYPSALQQPNTRFDSGQLASDGSDPMRKDVVELLLRVFQREGIQLVPVFNFNTPIVELERLRHGPSMQSSQDAEGMILIDVQGDSRLASLAKSRTPLSIYNPLDQRVRNAHTRMVKEFVDRYANRPVSDALAGVGFYHAASSVQTIPGQTWGVDRATLGRFLQETRTQVGQDPNWLMQLLGGDGRAAWLQWRQGQMGLWIDDLQNVAGHQKMFILGADLFETQDAFSELAPSLRRTGDITEAMARIGFPAERIAGDSGIMFLQPWEFAPEQTLAENRLNIQLNRNSEVTGPFRALGNAGTLFSHRYSWADFEQLRTQRMFGHAQQLPVMRLQPLTPSGKWNRQRLAQSVAANDSRVLVEGGWLTGFGQEEHIADFVEVYTQLPNVSFLDVPASHESDQPSSAGVVVRQSQVDDRNWFYAVNSTPWPMTAKVILSDNRTLVESAGEQLFFDNESDAPVLLVPLQPFSIQAAHVDRTIQIVGYSVDYPESITNELQDRLNSLLTKVSRAAQVEPIEVLENDGFEPSTDASQAFGWQFDNASSNLISLNNENPFAGQASLVLQSQGAANWVRSNPFPIPVTGRISVSAMIRTSDEAKQPNFRISVQGNDGHHVYYRYGVVGGVTRKIDSEWQEFAVHFDDLPLQDSGDIQVGFDLMGAGQVEIDQVRIFDRWLDNQDSRSLTQLLALANFQLSNKQNIDRCHRLLNGYWPRFLDEFFPDDEPNAHLAGEESEDRSSRLERKPRSRR